MSWPFQIAYEGDFRSLCTVTFGQKVDFVSARLSMKTALNNNQIFKNPCISLKVVVIHYFSYIVGKYVFYFPLKSVMLVICYILLFYRHALGQ